MDSKTPCAPSMDASSSGLDTAISAATTARSSPFARPMPIRAEPALDITDLTSAKSRLIRPGVVIRSVMPGHALQQHLVGLLERVQDADAAVGDREQPVVGDDDQRVDLFAQCGDAFLGLVGASPALERERPGHDADGQRAEGAGDPGDDGRASGTGATAFACGDEDHVGALDDLFDLFGVVFGCLGTDVGVGSRTEPARELAPDVELDVGVTHEQRLGVGVDGDELHAPQSDLDHPVDGVDSASADADNLDDRQVVLRCCHDACLSSR